MSDFAIGLGDFIGKPRRGAPVFTEKTFYLEEFYGKSLLFALIPPAGQRISDFDSLVLTLRELRRNQTRCVVIVSPSSLPKLMRRGLVHARRGPGGGYQLARKADTVTFRDIIEAVEGPITLNVCTDGSSSCALQPTCRMYRVWEKGQRVLLEVFSDTSLAEIAASRPSPATSAPMPVSSAKSGAA